MSIRSFFVTGLATCSVVVLLPTLLVLPFHEKTDGKLGDHLNQQLISNQMNPGKESNGIKVSVYRSKLDKVEKVPLDDYIVGVVASEMPAKFNEEALKAQALSARTFIVKRLEQGEKNPEGGDVTDTVMNQVYLNRDELKKVFGADYDWKIKKVEKAVASTKNEIITYDGQPITASFFSSSNGQTENSEDYWEKSVPYLKSVPSPWDQVAKDYIAKKVLSVESFQKKLDIKLLAKSKVGNVIERTKTNRIGKIAFGDKIMTGREVREKLDLRSTDFTLKREGNDIIITTVGNGHGIGMSQYGANELANQGKTYKEITQYYYQGVQITKISPSLLKK